MASGAVVRDRRSPQGPQVRAAAAAPARAALPLSRCCSPPPCSNSSSMPLFLLLLLVLLLLLEDAGAQQGDGCGHTVLGPESGTLASINYPQTYPNSTVCEWEIRVKVGERIRVKFGDFDIEDSDSCHFNYLRIYNGIGVSRTEIGKYCGLGLRMNHSIESKSNEITVLFMSGIHISGRGFLASYSVLDKQDLITCLDTASNFVEPEFSKYCPAGCLLPFGEISGTIPHGYRDSSPLCMAGVHAGVVSNILGGQISVVISKGIPYYESSLANNITSVVGHLSTSLFTFKTSGCYGTLGMESGVIADPQITASSVLEWTDHTGQENSWKPEKARLKKPGPPWAALATDEYQWLQVDLNKEKKITGIVTTGSTIVEHNYYVSAYKILYSDDGQKWTVYREPGVEQEKIFQGNKDYHQDVRNNFLPPIIARFIRVNPTQWQQKIAMKVELLGCQFIPKGRPPKLTQPPPPRYSNDLKNTTDPPKIAKGRGPKFTQPLQPRSRNEFPAQTEQTTATPEIKNTTVTPNVTKDVALAAVLVPVLVMVLTTLILISVCAWHWRSRKKKTEGTYDLPYWDRAEYAQPLVGGIVGTLHQRSTFKPEEGKEAGYADLDPYNSPVQEVYHAYAEPLPISGPEYATPIIMDMSGHPTASVGLPSTSTFKATGNQPPPLMGTYNTLLSRTDSCSSARAQYDTPKGGKPGPPAPDELVYQVPQSTQEALGAGRDGECDVFK
ncbi:discoidin, CUB and LCCL domain-containing protein 2 isoform X3 [Nycticebus coucang]|uniref:discoidin, CUB and LCCL domain-containing protein 2 isoform X3 n=1 Tax=Nycticebus coucang TaxID=9470 RepID=UPI00234D7838|nr:discoidin, CUB and LCCL domain-containing protein 2 isoform X3 [Nycticebus coucang]